jgi:VWFA-related protein
VTRDSFLQPQFRAVVDGVTVDAFAHDGGVPLAGLTRDDFVLRDNGVVQQIDAIGTTESAHVIVGLDVSHSVDGEALEQMRSAVRTVHGQLTHADRLSLLTFGNRVRILQRAVAPGRDLEAVLAAMVPNGSTVLHDALVAGTALARADHRPAVFLMLTDGQDTGSWSTAAAAIDAIRHGHVVVYPVGAGLPDVPMASVDAEYMRERTWLAPQPGDTLRLLQSVAEISGGQFLRVGRGARLERTFGNILAQYRQRYLITFTPSARATSGWHRLDVRLRNRAGTVVAREGYMAGRP